MSLPNQSRTDEGENSPGSPKPPIIPFGKTTIMEKKIDTNIAAAVCYLPLMPICLIASVVLYMSPSDNNQFARFHAAQAAIMAVAVTVVLGVLGGVTSFLGMIPLIGMLAFPLALLQIVLVLGYTGLSLFVANRVFRGQDFRLPVVGPLAEQLTR